MIALQISARRMSRNRPRERPTAKELTVRLGAHVLVGVLLALPATQASFAQDEHPQNTDHAPQSAAGQEGGLAPISNDHSTEDMTKPDEPTPQKSAGAPAKTEGNAPPNVQQGIATPDAPHERKGEHLQKGDVKNTVTGSAVKNAPGASGPAKELGSVDTHMTVPTELPTNQPNDNHSGKKPFKIAIPNKVQLRHVPAAGAAGVPRNAIGMSITPNTLTHGGNSEPGGHSAPGAPVIVVKGPNVSPAINSNLPSGDAHSLAPYTPSNSEKIGSIGPIRPALVRPGIGGPAKTSEGIDGNSFRIKR
jgi:hypothetical protein